MSVLSFPLKKQQRSVVWLYFFVLETKRDMNQQPEVFKKKKERAKKKKVTNLGYLWSNLFPNRHILKTKIGPWRSSEICLDFL